MAQRKRSGKQIAGVAEYMRAWGMLLAVAQILSIACCGEWANGNADTRPAVLNVSAAFPAAGAKAVCIDTPLRLTFDTPPTLGTGVIKVLDASSGALVQRIDVAATRATQSIGGMAGFNYRPIIITGDEAAIFLANGVLEYNKTYLVTVDPGAFKNEAGPFSGIDATAHWRFSTKAAPPPAGTTRLTVAADGSGDFCTVQGAVDFVPEGNTTRTTIFLRKGTYTGLIYFARKNAITFEGEDREGTTLAYENNARFNPSTQPAYHRGVLLAAHCDDLVIKNLTMRNTTPRGGSQAETIILNGNTTSRAIIANVDLYSFQDTLQINGQAYISNCYIEGDVDFMWGRGPCFFEHCHCYCTRSKGFFTQIRNPATNHGYVYHQCTFDGPEGESGMILSRVAPAVYPYSEMVMMDCVLGKGVGAVGWQLDAPNPGAHLAMPPPTGGPVLHFWEYNSHGFDGHPVDVSKRLGVSRQLKLPEDAKLISEYSQAAFVLGNGWDVKSDPNLPTASEARDGGP